MELRGSADRREAVIKRIDLIGRNGSKIRSGPAARRQNSPQSLTSRVSYARAEFRLHGSIIGKRAEEGRGNRAAPETESAGDTQHQGLPASVYTQVYTGVENSGPLGPHASKRSQSETALAKRICPPLSTWDLLRPQPPKLFANETLCQLSYTPKNSPISDSKKPTRSKSGKQLAEDND